VSEQEALEIGVEAYIYGYPLVTMEMTRRVMTNVAHRLAMKAPIGQFANAREYPNASFKDVTVPNADTLYSVAWLDLSREPYVLHVPDEAGRYYLMPMLDGWTNVFASPGKRTTGTKAGDYSIKGPHWKGVLPRDVALYKSSTDMVWIIGRICCTGTPEDFKQVHAIQDQYSSSPDYLPAPEWAK
jgi:DNA sulfur modification protein DndE